MIRSSRHMFFRIFSISVTLAALFLPMFVFAQSSNTLPVATTAVVAGASASGTQVVVYDQQADMYGVSKKARDASVYGVTAISPAIVFATASGTMPVVTQGTTKVQVTAANGPITRGDILTTATSSGTAMRADLSDDAVFAVALEGFGNATTSATGTILAQVGVDDARALQLARRDTAKQSVIAASSTDAAGTKMVSYTRDIIAAIIAIGGLLFILYSFRSTLSKGVVSIGRNPRARTSIITLAFGNIIFALLLCAVVIFIALGVLVLPV